MLKQLSLLSLLLVGCAGQSGPTPAPTVAPSPSATPTPKGLIQFRAVIQNANGEPIKVARTSFTALPYDSEALRLAIEKRNNPGPKPSFSEPEPKASDARFQNQVNCLTELENGQDSGRFQPRDAAQEAAVSRGEGCKLLLELEHGLWDKKRLAQIEAMGVWTAKATAGLAEAQQAAAAGRKAVSWQTDLEGKAQIFLDPGNWFISGNFDVATATIEWKSVQVTVSPATTQIELNEADAGDAPKG